MSEDNGFEVCNAFDNLGEQFTKHLNNHEPAINKMRQEIMTVVRKNNIPVLAALFILLEQAHVVRCLAKMPLGLMRSIDIFAGSIARDVVDEFETTDEEETTH